jgi:hypothetical protein
MVHERNSYGFKSHKVHFKHHTAILHYKPFMFYFGSDGIGVLRPNLPRHIVCSSLVKDGQRFAR